MKSPALSSLRLAALAASTVLALHVMTTPEALAEAPESQVTSGGSRGEAEREAGEYAVKAAFLYHFGKFVTWPESTFENRRSPFRIGILGADPFGKELSPIARQRRVGGRRIEILHFAATGEEIQSCHILFVPGNDFAGFAEIRAQAREQHTLTVGENSAFLEAGGMIAMPVVEEYIALEINEAEAWAAGLEISANLLDVAVKVISRPRESGE